MKAELFLLQVFYKLPGGTGRSRVRGRCFAVWLASSLRCPGPIIRLAGADHDWKLFMTIQLLPEVGE